MPQIKIYNETTKDLRIKITNKDGDGWVQTSFLGTGYSTDSSWNTIKGESNSSWERSHTQDVSVRHPSLGLQTCQLSPGAYFFYEGGIYKRKSGGSKGDLVVDYGQVKVSNTLKSWRWKHYNNVFESGKYSFTVKNEVKSSSGSKSGSSEAVSITTEVESAEGISEMMGAKLKISGSASKTTSTEKTKTTTFTDGSELTVEGIGPKTLWRLELTASDGSTALTNKIWETKLKAPAPKFTDREIKAWL